MATAEILDISPLPHDDRVAGFELDRDNLKSPGHHLTVSGWARAPDAPARVRVLFEGRVLCATDANLERAGAGPCGFACSFSVLGLPNECDLRVEALVPGVPPIAVAGLRVRREPLALDPATGLRPVIVRSLGRSGSTWAMTVLGRHPEIVVYGAFEYEPNVARWWAD